MILECIVIIIFILFFAWFVLGIDTSNMVTFILAMLIIGALSIFAGICMKFGWNLF